MSPIWFPTPALAQTFASSTTARTKRLRSFEVLLEALVAVHAPLFLISASSELLGERIMKGLVTTLGLVLVFLCELFGEDRTAKARVTAYWRGEGGSAKAAATGAALREGHCAVD